MTAIDVANINGRITPVESAVIPVNDHGFLYGDSVYETVRTYGRRPFLMDRHLERLWRSAAAIRLSLAWTREDIARESGRTLQAAGGEGELALRIMATRGPGPMGYDPELCPHPTLVILTRPLPPATIAESEHGVTAAVVAVRRNPIVALDPRIKSSNLLNNILAAQQAKDAGAQEAILFNTTEHLAEGTLTNVFLVRDAVVKTPSLDCGLLSGVTRELVLEMAGADGMAVEEGRYDRADLDGAQEIFLTGTTREILPVATLDGRPVGQGRRGPVTARLQQLFQARVRAFLREA
ncbi:MAG: aminotransferase class IV [Candidatus Polarisedimenticolia bacterium]